MKCISKSRLLPLLSGQGFHRLQLEVIVQMEIVEILPVDQQIQHVVALPGDLEAALNPIYLCDLEEFGCLKGLQQASLVLNFWLLFV